MHRAEESNDLNFRVLFMPELLAMFNCNTVCEHQHHNFLRYTAAVLKKWRKQHHFLSQMINKRIMSTLQCDWLLTFIRCEALTLVYTKSIIIIQNLKVKAAAFLDNNISPGWANGWANNYGFTRVRLWNWPHNGPICLSQTYWHRWSKSDKIV